MFRLALIALLGSVSAMRLTQSPVTNHCTNANKATGVDQACADGGNSAWNTHTSAVTKKPTAAQNPPYPDHPAVTYGVNGEIYTA